jgi:glycerol-3-phosphate O-acyltransferase/dihydroxyacetone phosphate acyltransferase
MIGGWILIYGLLRFLLGTAVGVFFRRIEVEGIENVPDTGPVLLLPNHPNALVDALIIIMQLKRPVSLTAKSTLADNPLLRFFIRVSQVILLNRKQDTGLGADRSRNVDALKECQRRLGQGAAICLFPEGQSHSDPSLRPFRWGAARIALEFAQTSESSEALRIIPVGLNFLQKDRFRSDAWIRFGVPINVTKWIMDYPQGGPTELTEEIERHVRDLTLNFNRRRDSVLMDWAAELIATGGLPPVPIGQKEDNVSHHLGLVRLIRDGYENLKEQKAVEIDELRSRIVHYRRELRHFGIASAEVYILMTAWRAVFFLIQETTVLLVGLPVAVWGIVNHLTPALLVRAVARKLTVEKDQWASNTVFPAVILFPLFYTVQITLAWLYLTPWLAAAYTAGLPVSGYASVRYSDRAGSTWRRSRTFILFLLNPQLQTRLAKEGKQIIEKIQLLGEEV